MQTHRVLIMTAYGTLIACVAVQEQEGYVRIGKVKPMFVTCMYREAVVRAEYERLSSGRAPNDRSTSRRSIPSPPDAIELAIQAPSTCVDDGHA